MQRGFWLAVVMLLALVACAGSDDSDTTSRPAAAGPSEPSPSTTTSTGSESSPTTVLESSPTPTTTPPVATRPTVVAPGDCPADGRLWSNAESTELAVLADQPLRIRASVYPTPSYDARLWSQWGQGVVLDDGRFLSALGDHMGKDGNSFFYVYDPNTNTLRLISDVLSLTDHQSGDWGYGKVHAQMVLGACGDVYVTSYWGTRSGLEFGGSYSGDILMRIDPQSETITNLNTLVSGHGVPSLAISPDGGDLFAEGADPTTDQGVFIARDMESGAEIFRDNDSAHTGFRAMAVDTEGRAYYSIGEGRLRRYDPVSGEVADLADRMPGEFLRAATPPDETGTIVAVTQDEPTFFTLDTDGTITSLSRAPGYTTSLARNGNLVYFIPDAHGGAWESGTPVMVLDVATGKQTVLVELNDLAERELGLRLGGTYNIAIDSQAGRLFIGLNAAPPDSGSTFGAVVLVVIDL